MFTRPPIVTEMSAVTGLGNFWTGTWHALLSGKRCTVRSSDLEGLNAVDILTCAVRDLDRTIDADGRGPAFRLLERALMQLETGFGDGVQLYGGSNHGESGLLLNLREGATSGQGTALIQDSLPQISTPNARWTYAACSSGLHALAAAVLDIADGAAGEVVVAAADALSALEIVGFKRVDALTRGACLPFHTARDGLLIGEGAAAIRIGGVPTPEHRIGILGFGLSCDAWHPTDPDPSGNGIERAIRSALAAAHLAPEAVAGVIAHGTATHKNDSIEAEVFHRLWPHQTVPVTSVKGSLGHTMGAAGLLNLCVAVAAARDGVLPPIAPGVSAMLPGADFVMGTPREITRGRPLLALASGFGGNNAAFVVGRIAGP